MKSYNKVLCRSMEASLHMSVEETVDTFLSELGFSKSLKGFAYLSDAIIMTYQNPELKYNMVEKLYVLVAKKHNTTAMCVERAMRNILHKQEYFAGERLINAYFNSMKIPPAKKFILAVVERLHLQFDEEYFVKK